MNPARNPMSGTGRRGRLYLPLLIFAVLAVPKAGAGQAVPIAPLPRDELAEEGRPAVADRVDVWREKTLRVAITGSSGLVGTSLREDLAAQGQEFLRLVRRQPRVDLGEIHWSPESGEIDAAGLEGVDAVVHLAGENISTQAGIRTVRLRLGIVLSSRGGALEMMRTPFRLGLGGRLGSGDQYMSWIHLEEPN